MYDKQTLSLCHIGLMKDHGGHVVTNPVFCLLTSFMKKWLKIDTVRKKNTVTEHGEEKLQMCTPTYTKEFI